MRNRIKENEGTERFWTDRNRRKMEAEKRRQDDVLKNEIK